MTVNRTTLLDLPLPVTGTESGTWGDITNNGLTEYMDVAIAGMSNLTSANFTAGALTIETTEGTAAGTNITATSAQYAGFRVSSLAVNSTITVGNTGTSPARSYRLINADATYSLTFKATGQTGVTLLPGQSAVVAFNGTDYVIVGVVGAGSTTDNTVPRFDGTTGEILQSSGVTIDDSNNVSGVAQLNITTLDATNIEVTNIKAKDGTAAASIADSTGVVSFSANPVLSGGTANGVLYLDGSKVATSGSALTFDGTNLATTGTATATKLIPTGNVTAGNGMYLPTTNTLAWSNNGSETMRLNSSGNLGVGVTPSAWSQGRAIELLAPGMGLFNAGSLGGPSLIYLTSNAYVNSGFKYGVNGEASNYLQWQGAHIWSTAPSGTAGNAITFTQVMTLDASGNLGIGTSSPTAKLSVDGSAVFNESGADVDFRVESDTNTHALFVQGNNGYVGIGASSPVNELEVYGSNTPRFAIRSAESISEALEIGFQFGTGANASTNTLALLRAVPTQVDPSPLKADLTFSTNIGDSVTERMRLDSSGNLGLGVTPSAGYGLLQVNTSSTALPTTDSNVPSGRSYGYFVNSASSSDWLLLRGPYSGGLNSTHTAGILLQDQFQDNGAYGGRYVQASGLSLIFGRLNNGTLGSSNGTLAEQMRLDSSGNLGLGVTPGTWGSNFKAIQVGDYAAFSHYLTAAAAIVSSNARNSNNTDWVYLWTGVAATRYETGLGAHRWFTAPSGTAGNAITFTQAMTLNASGNLGVGTSSPTTRLHISQSNSGNYASVILLSNSADAAADRTGIYGSSSVGIATPYRGGITFWPGDVGTLTFHTGNNASPADGERVRITSGGYFKASNDGTYLNSTGSYHELTNAGDNPGAIISCRNASQTGNTLQAESVRNTTNNTFYALSYYNSGAAAYKFRVADSGDVTNTNNSYGAISDVKTKQDIVDAASQWDDIKGLRVRKFRYKNDPTAPLQIGLVAQEAETVSPGLIDEHPDYEEVEVTDEEGNVTKERQLTGTSTKSVKYSVLYMKAIKALQEAMTRIEQLEAKVSALEGTQP